MSVRLGTIVIDCADPESLAAFWCAVLDWHVVDRDDDGSIEIGARDQRQVTLLFEPVEEPKQVKNRIHIDLNPSSGSDQSTELERLLGLGARPADVGQGDETWVVLADPAGNEFCLLRTPSPELHG